MEVPWSFDNRVAKLWQRLITFFTPGSTIRRRRMMIAMLQLGLPRVEPIEDYNNSRMELWAKMQYKYIHKNCDKLYSNYYGNSVDPPEILGTPTAHSSEIEFFHKLILVLAAKIIKIRIYTNISQGNSQLLATTFWELLMQDLRSMLSKHYRKRKLCTELENYFHLYYKVKWLYKTYVVDLPPVCNSPPLYEKYFFRILSSIFEVYQKALVDNLNNDTPNDKIHVPTFVQFPESAVVELLTTCFDAVSSLETQNLALKNMYLRRFTQTVRIAIKSYDTSVRNDFYLYSDEILIALTLGASVKEIKHQLYYLYLKMGGANLEPFIVALLEELTKKLNDTINSFEKYEEIKLKPRVLLRNEVNHENVDLRSSLEEMERASSRFWLHFMHKFGPFGRSYEFYLTL